MQRDFFKQAGGTSLALGASAFGIKTVRADPTYKWKMVTAWPKNFPGMGIGANRLAELIGEMSGGRIRVKVYGAGELVPAFEVFDTVAQGAAELGHSSASYWKGKNEAAQFFTAVPFGMTAQERNGWLYHGGDLELWTELYARFGLVPAPAGNTGVQMGDWFNKEIKSVVDLAGLKMRIPGLGGEVLKRAGGTPVTLPGGERFVSLQSGAIDATELGRTLQRPSLRPPEGGQILLLSRLPRARLDPGGHYQPSRLRDPACGSEIHRAQCLQGSEPGPMGRVYRP